MKKALTVFVLALAAVILTGARAAAAEDPHSNSDTFEWGAPFTAPSAPLG